MFTTKRIGWSLCLAASVFVFAACDPDNEDEVKDAGDPTVSITAPLADAIAVSGTNLIATATIADDLELASVVVTLEDDSEVLFTETIEEFDDLKAYSYSKSIAIADDAALGAKTLTIEVTDKAGNTSSDTKSIEIYPVYEAGKVTIMVTAPDYTPEEEAVHVVGDFQIAAGGAGDWDPADAMFALSKYADGTYYISVPLTDAQQFKFARGSWEKVEKGPQGEELTTNRKVEAGATKYEAEIGQWRDFVPQVPEPTVPGFIPVGLSVPFKITTGEITSAPSTGAELANVNITVGVSGSENVYDHDFAATGTSASFESESLDPIDWPAGEYVVTVTVTDADGAVTVEPRRKITIDEFPCADPAGDVAVTMTRVRVRVAPTTDDVYITGKLGGAEVWGTKEAQYKMEKISDGCYYIDIALAAGDIIQVIRDNAGYADWWRGQATNTAGSDATANTNVTVASNGNEIISYYQFWREDPL